MVASGDAVSCPSQDPSGRIRMRLMHGVQEKQSIGGTCLRPPGVGPLPHHRCAGRRHDGAPIQIGACTVRACTCGVPQVIQWHGALPVLTQACCVSVSRHAHTTPRWVSSKLRLASAGVQTGLANRELICRGVRISNSDGARSKLASDRTWDACETRRAATGARRGCAP